ncbi:MAG: TetR/AcrR family transcriptional regulator [Methanobacterium sp.]|uniref:TetR/AcrR family transcriptional regulator n=1 Tax=Methanobacterium sp. TaxID=2164 RepID=UPI003D65AB2C|nr:TetR/AcrR family transcriptional regulator [Methanobacterium sp.]
MARNTEQKIIESALVVFAKKGYTGATTRFIAEKAGFSELTLFRKFKTKENLYNKVLTQNMEKLKDELEIIFVNMENKFKDPKDFTRALITDIAKIIEDNFQIIYLMNSDINEEYESFKFEFITLISEFMKKNLKNDEINYQTFAITIFSFVYMRSLSKYKGSDFVDFDDVLESFIKNSTLCI